MRDIEVSSGKRKTFEGAAYNVVVGNCQFFGDGIRVSPRSYPGDGVLDVLIMKGPKSDAYTTLPKQYRGEHVPSDHIDEMSGKIVTIKSKGKALPVHVDGEAIGTTPATFEVIPKAVRLKV
jgi:diacylglycerol kinase family enzyme